MESQESKEHTLAILYEMFHNHSPSKILSTCEEKQWKIESCIESLLQNASSQGAVPKATTRKVQSPKFELSSSEQKILNLIQAGYRVMVIMRGAPGSGKSYLARAIVQRSMPDIKPNEMKNHIFSTDDYFTNRRGVYNRQVSKLSEAHSDNQRKVQEKVKAGISPIIVDNTNLQIWEMMPYVQIAVRNGYYVELLEPNTPWRNKAGQLAQRNAHGVPVEKIKQMLDKYEKTTAGQLVQMLNRGTSSVQSHANPKPQVTSTTQSTSSTLNAPPLEQRPRKISVNVATSIHNQNVQNRNEQNVLIQNKFYDGHNTSFDIYNAPFRDITSQTESNKNIIEYENLTFQQNNQIAMHSTTGFKNISAPKSMNVSTQTEDEYEEKNDTFVELQLSTNIVNQLQAFFGSEENEDINFFEDTNDFLTVFLPQALARNLYNLCYKAKHENDQKRTKEVDENFAKLLQNSKYSEINEAPKNLQELLDYEMALRLLSKEKEEHEQDTQENLATYLKNLKVTENFLEPTNEPEKIFEDKIERNVTYGKEDKSLALSDFEEFRNLAVHHCQLKAECYQKAKEMVQKGNNAVAGYYSQIAHFHKKKIDMYNERAANCIVEVHRLTSDNRDLLDLHHLHVAEAVECLDLFLDHHISNIRSTTRTYKNIFIITGRGLHSTGGVSIIKNKVKARLKDRNLKWNEVNPGLLKVKIFSSSRFSK